MPPVSNSKTEPAESVTWSLRARFLVSVWLMLHLAAVFFPPFAFETSPIPGMGSPVAESMIRFLQPYIDAAYLNHGYAFFAPNPGPSHLLRAKLEFTDGREPREITLPDLDSHWPRLLYHRHFMLSEHLHSSFAPSQPIAEVTRDPLQTESWQQALQMYTARKNAIKRHLQTKYGASQVSLTRIEHRLLDPFEVVGLGKQPGDTDTYLELSELALPEARP